MLDAVPRYSATLTQATGTPPIWEPEFVRLLHEVEGIYDGSNDYSKGALYWCDSRHIETDFFKDKILGRPEDHPRIGEMNTLMLFK